MITNKLVLSAYYCPNCGSDTSGMKLVGLDYEPTTTQLRLAHLLGKSELEHIGHEILLCKCGYEWTWFDLDLKTVQPIESKIEEQADGLFS